MFFQMQMQVSFNPSQEQSPKSLGWTGLKQFWGNDMDSPLEVLKPVFLEDISTCKK